MDLPFASSVQRRTWKVFQKVTVIWFRKAKNFKDFLVRAKVAPLEKKEGCCRSCEGTRCEMCKHVMNTETFRFSTQREYCIKPKFQERKYHQTSFCSHSMSDWEISFIVQADSVDSLRKEKSFLQRVFLPSGNSMPTDFTMFPLSLYH